MPYCHDCDDVTSGFIFKLLLKDFPRPWIPYPYQPYHTLMFPNIFLPDHWILANVSKNRLVTLGVQSE